MIQCINPHYFIFSYFQRVGEFKATFFRRPNLSLKTKKKRKRKEIVYNSATQIIDSARVAFFNGIQSVNFQNSILYTIFSKISPRGQKNRLKKDFWWNDKISSSDDKYIQMTKSGCITRQMRHQEIMKTQKNG